MKNTSKNLKKTLSYISFIGGTLVCAVGLILAITLGFKNGNIKMIVIGNVVLIVGLFFVIFGNVFLKNYQNQERIICQNCQKRLDPKRVKYESNGNHKKSYSFTVHILCECGRQNAFNVSFSAINYESADDKLLKYLTKLFKQEDNN